MSCVKKGLLLFGKCVISDMPSALRVVAGKFEMDKALTMYFKENDYYYADGGKHQCKPGDFVVIKESPSPKSRKIPYEVQEIVYKYGCIIDPITGKQCFGNEYIDDTKRICEMFGTKLRFLEQDNKPTKELQ